MVIARTSSWSGWWLHQRLPNMWQERRTRFAFGIFFFSIAAVFYFNFGNLFYLSSVSTPAPKDKRDIQQEMPVDGNEFWLQRAKEQGLSLFSIVTAIGEQPSGDRISSTSSSSSSSSSSSLVLSTEDNTMITEMNFAEQRQCMDFMAIWPGDCLASFKYLDERMRTLSAQMVAMNATLYFFTSDMRGCAFSSYKGIKVRKYNTTDELITHGFEEAMPIMETWNKGRFTRISDILRLCLAYHYRLSYLDTDVHFLQLQKHWYLRPYVGAQMYGDNKNAIEITNAAFCLPKGILADMMNFQRNKIIRGGINYKYFYTELGPSMFHHVLMNRRAIPLYSQNHPAEPSLEKIAQDIRHFGHKQLHLTGHVRKGNKGMTFDQLVNAIRKKTGLPELRIDAAI